MPSSACWCSCGPEERVELLLVAVETEGGIAVGMTAAFSRGDGASSIRSRLAARSLMRANNVPRGLFGAERSKQRGGSVSSAAAR